MWKCTLPMIAALAMSSTAIAQEWQANPTYGAVVLESGFMPDPHTVDLLAGGTINAYESVGTHCRGYITSQPDYDLYYAAGEYPLIISVGSAADTTLVVRAPDGTWHCDDDGGVTGFNPAVIFTEPESGLYDIWVGKNDPDPMPAILGISEGRSF